MRSHDERDAPGRNTPTRTSIEVDAGAGDTDDSRLGLLLRATGAAREREIERLIVDVARPVSAAILAHYRRAWSTLRHQDVDDITATVDVRFLEKLRTIDGAPDNGVQDLERYAATLTYNAINDHLRRAFPVRARLKNRLRYLLLRDARFGLWLERGALYAGLSTASDAPCSDSRIDMAENDVTRVMRDGNRPAGALAQILARAGCRVALDRLVDLVARLWNIADAPSPAPEPESIRDASGGGGAPDAE